VRISVISTGRVRQKRGKRVSGGIRRRLARRNAPGQRFVIEHRLGLCVVDAGQTAVAAQPDYFPRWYPSSASRGSSSLMRKRRPDGKGGLRPATRAMGRAHPSAHGSRWWSCRAPNAEVIVSRTEWEAAQGSADESAAIFPSDGRRVASASG
jgi:hypothetical protein